MWRHWKEIVLKTYRKEMTCPCTQMRLAARWKWFSPQETQTSASNTKEGWPVPTLEVHLSSVVSLETTHLCQAVSPSANVPWHFAGIPPVGCLQVRRDRSSDLVRTREPDCQRPRVCRGKGQWENYNPEGPMPWNMHWKRSVKYVWLSTESPLPCPVSILYLGQKHTRWLERPGYLGTWGQTYLLVWIKVLWFGFWYG